MYIVGLTHQRGCCLRLTLWEYTNSSATMDILNSYLLYSDNTGWMWDMTGGRIGCVGTWVSV